MPAGHDSGKWNPGSWFLRLAIGALFTLLVFFGASACTKGEHSTAGTGSTASQTAIPVVVPDVTGQRLADARGMITIAGLLVGREDTVSSEDYPSGIIVSQSPPAHARVPAGTAVDLRVVR